ncbi:unnamed protein product, partial [Heterosigma akashiwo]
MGALSRNFQVPPDFIGAIANGWEVSAADMPIREAKDFVSGSLTFCEDMWKEILRGHPREEQMLGWIRDGVKVEPFLNPDARGSYKGISFKGPVPQRRAFKNNIPDEFVPWVREEIQDWLKKGCAMPWDPVLFGSEQPELILPLGVEPSKPRLIYDARWLNLFCKEYRFTLDSVEKAGALAWQGCFMASIDLKSAYHHIKLCPSSFRYFGFSFENVVYVFTTLCFGWSLAPYIFQSFSDAIAGYCRRLLRHIGLLIYLDDSWMTGDRRARQLGMEAEFRSCNLSTFVFGSILIQKLMAQVQTALQSGWVSFQELEKIIGRCVSMSVAVRCAMLYVREMYKCLLPFLRGRGKTFAPRELREELSMWLNLPSSLINGSPWPGTRVWNLRVEGSTDASSRRWGGVGRSVGSCSSSEGNETFVAAGDFSEEEARLHIAEKEVLALVRVFKGFLEQRPKSETEGALFSFKCDSQVVVHIYNNGGSNHQATITRACKDLFLLQLQYNCSLRLTWIPTGDNKIADDLTREDSSSDVMLANWVFLWLCREFHYDCDVDTMASAANVQRDGQGLPLAFYSRYYNEGCAGVDMFTKN